MLIKAPRPLIDWRSRDDTSIAAPTRRLGGIPAGATALALITLATLPLLAAKALRRGEGMNDDAVRRALIVAMVAR